MFKDQSVGRKLIGFIILLLVASLSIGVISPYVSAPVNRSNALDTLDDQKLTAMGLTATITSAAFLVSAIPDDTGSSLADELDDLSTILMLIVCVIYLEKFLLTTTGLVSFSILIPVACALWGISLFRPERFLRSWAIKIVIFALLLFTMVPSGVILTNMVEDTFKESIDQSFSAVEKFSSEVEDPQAEDNKNALQQFFSGIGDSFTRVFDTAKNLLSALTDAVAVLVITTCAIPLITMFFFMWIIKIIFGYQIKLPPPRRLPHSPKHPELPDHP